MVTWRKNVVQHVKNFGTNLGSNRIHPIVYATALHELIIHGIGKFHNILTIDPTNCGKNIFIKAPWRSI